MIEGHHSQRMRFGMMLGFEIRGSAVADPVRVHSLVEQVDRRHPDPPELGPKRQTDVRLQTDHLAIGGILASRTNERNPGSARPRSCDKALPGHGQSARCPEYSRPLEHPEAPADAVLVDVSASSKSASPSPASRQMAGAQVEHDPGCPAVGISAQEGRDQPQGKRCEQQCEGTSFDPGGERARQPASTQRNVPALAPCLSPAG